MQNNLEITENPNVLIDDPQVWAHQFDNLKAQGVLIADSFASDKWVIDDEHRTVGIDFKVDLAMYAKHGQVELGIPPNAFALAVRAYVLTNIKCCSTDLQVKIHRIIEFAVTGHIDTQQAIYTVNDFVRFLPSSDAIDALLYRLEDIYMSKTSASSNQQRSLALFVSYFRFHNILTRFWRGASCASERIKYFAIWFWWSITAILPLRATECALTPYDCIRKDGDQCYLTVRRTRLKTNNVSAKHRIDDDYYLCEYPITQVIYDQIAWYREQTLSCSSDIDTLFRAPNISKASYGWLVSLLQDFYVEVVCGQYGMAIVNDDVQILHDPHCIERVHLGDTRHIALISLMVMGNSHTICKALAGHESVDITAHYYSNITSFLDGLVDYPTYVQEYLPTLAVDPAEIADRDQVMALSPAYDGVCTSKRALSGNYEICEMAVGVDSRIGDCSVCPYYRGNTDSSIGIYTEQMRSAIMLLRHAIDTVSNDGIRSAIMQIQAVSRAYYTRSAIGRRMTDLVIADKSEGRY